MNVIDKRLEHIRYLYHKRLSYGDMLIKLLINKDLEMAMIQRSEMKLKLRLAYYKESLHIDIDTVNAEDIVKCSELAENIKSAKEQIEKLELRSERNQIYIEGLQKKTRAWIFARNELMEQLYQQYILCDDDLQPFNRIEGDYKKDVQKRLGELKISNPNQDSQI